MGRETYHIDAVHPELLKGGVRGDVVGDAQESEVCVLHGSGSAFVRTTSREDGGCCEGEREEAVSILPGVYILPLRVATITGTYTAP